MKRTIRWFAIAAALALCAAPVLAQSSGAKECNDDNKAAWYDTFLKNRNGEAPQQKIAYDTARQYLSSCPDAPDDQIVQYLKKWVTAYEKGNRRNQFEDAFIKKDYAKVADLGKQLLADDASNVRVHMLLGYGGFLAAGTNPMSAESLEYARKAIEMIESGKAPESWVPFATRDQGMAWLNYAIGKAKLTSAPSDALPFLIKAARFESELKKDPTTYLAIAQAYESGPLTKQSEDYKVKYGGKDETPESKLAFENINQIVDRMIDAYARATALSTGDNKKILMDALTERYTDRNKSPAGVNELVAGILSKPVPDVPTPLTSLPTPAPTPTTPATISASPEPTPNTASGTTPTKAGTNATTPPPTSTVKPSPTPVKPKPRGRANHRRRG